VELTLDASYGEGGGQILRTALSLAVLRRRPVVLQRVRARRPKPGLQPQHLAVVRALAEISEADVHGDRLDSTEVRFAPRTLRGGEYRFDVGAVKGSAGSVSLLFQALLLPLAFAAAPSRLTLIGGTHVPWSPPVHYLTAVYLAALRRIAVDADVALRRWGWYPRGGGVIEAVVTPTRVLGGLRWENRAPPEVIAGVSAVSRLPLAIAERQRRRALERLEAAGLTADIALVEDTLALGPGTLLFLAAAGSTSVGGASALGRRGLRAEAVADAAVDELLAYLGSGAVVDDHLADQLVPFLALAREESVFTCPSLTDHLRTVAWVVAQLAGARVELSEGTPARVRVTPAARQPPD
jgi:RNA 3'-terminal phosphate cyclase (ATP)